MRIYLANKRKELKLTQEEVAQKINMKRAAYAHIETGRNEPSLEQIEKICKVFEIDQSNIIDFFRNYLDEEKSVS